MALTNADTIKAQIEYMRAAAWREWFAFYDNDFRTRMCEGAD